MKTVTMHFGDGSYKTIQVECEDGTKECAEREAEEWVTDNAWFEADPDQDWEEDDD